VLVAPGSDPCPAADGREARETSSAPPKPPMLGEPNHNIVKANFEEIKIDCLLYRIAPAVEDGVKPTS
jgi:hypothetical protein